MRKIIPEIFTKKLLYLFVENRKKTFNLNQIRYYLNSVIDIKNLKTILYDFVKRGYLISVGNDKFIFNSKLNLLTARIKKRYIIDLETGVEFKPRRRELRGVFDNEIVYYFIDRKSNVRIFSNKNREETRYVGKVIEENGRSYVKVPKKILKL
jgi:hypothetical protein